MSFWIYHFTVSVNFLPKILCSINSVYSVFTLSAHVNAGYFFCYASRKQTAASSLNLPNFPIYFLKSFLHPPESLSTFFKLLAISFRPHCAPERLTRCQRLRSSPIVLNTSKQTTAMLKVTIGGTEFSNSI